MDISGFSIFSSIGFELSLDFVIISVLYLVFTIFLYFSFLLLVLIPKYLISGIEKLFKQ